MTLRDVGAWFSGTWESVKADLSMLRDTNIMDWPLWVVVLVGLPIAGVTLHTMATMRDEEDYPEKQRGFGGSIFVPLILLVAFGSMSYFVLMTNQTELSRWLAFISVPATIIGGYGVLLKVARRRWWGVR